MGVAQLLAVPDTVPILAGVGPRTPMLRPDQVLRFANGSSTAFERQTIEELGIEEVPVAQVTADPMGAAHGVVMGWARRFEHLLVHVDVDVLDFLDFPIAEETRRHRGLRFAQLVTALRELVEHQIGWPSRSARSTPTTTPRVVDAQAQRSDRGRSSWRRYPRTRMRAGPTPDRNSAGWAERSERSGFD